ncbi:MAG: hypothetical protein MUD01_11990 [Chloroflexaceae bacterium]|nr:hypothetical protein [Chloroflexaceae bacterium]
MSLELSNSTVVAAKRPSFLLWAITIGLVLGAITGAVLIFMLGRPAATPSDPRAAMQQFADAVVQENYAATVPFLRPGPAHGSTAQDLLPLLRAELEREHGPLKKAVAQAASLRGTNAGEIEIVWHFARGQVSSRWQLQRAEGRWQIVNFQLDMPTGPTV